MIKQYLRTITISFQNHRIYSLPQIIIHSLVRDLEISLTIHRFGEFLRYYDRNTIRNYKIPHYYHTRHNGQPAV